MAEAVVNLVSPDLMMIFHLPLGEGDMEVGSLEVEEDPLACLVHQASVNLVKNNYEIMNLKVLLENKLITTK